MLVVRRRSAETPRPSLLCDQVCISNLASHLRWCASFNAINEGMAAHHHIIKHDLHRNPFLHNLLLHFYGECGVLDAAHALFALYPRDVFSYNFMIAAFAHTKQHSEALHLFHHMHLEAILPDRVTHTTIFSTLASLSVIEAGRFLHACILHCLHVSVATAIMHMYGKCGSLQDAQLVFQHMHEPDVVAWNCILGVHVDHNNSNEALVLYRRMKHEGVDPDKVTFISLLSACGGMSDLCIGEQFHFELICKGYDVDTVVGNALVSMYVKFYFEESAHVVFEKMPERSVASWNTMIGAHSQRNERAEALNLFNRMQEEGVEPNKTTFLKVIPACLPQDALRLFGTVNDGDVVLWNALLSSLYAFRQHCQAIQLFSRMQVEAVMPNKSTFLIIMSVCSSQQSLSLGKQMNVLASSELEHNISVGNAIITMYGNCFSLDYAKKTFNILLERSVITWTTMITMLSHYNEWAEAVHSFDRMLLEGVLPDEFVFASALDACISLAVGKHIHARILETQSNVKAVMGTALLSMYSDCGCLRAAESVFNQIFQQNTICHNAIIIAFAHHGQAQCALGLFEHMCVKNISADSNTYLGLMTAFSHCGLIEEGIYHFCSMQNIYDLQWRAEHFDCIIDLFGRAGQVNESLLVLDTLHVNPTALTYRTLLSACCKSGDVICGRQAANQAFILEPENEGCYFMLLNVLLSDSFLDL